MKKKKKSLEMSVKQRLKTLKINPSSNNKKIIKMILIKINYKQYRTNFLDYLIKLSLKFYQDQDVPQMTKKNTFCSKFQGRETLKQNLLTQVLSII